MKRKLTSLLLCLMLLAALALPVRAANSYAQDYAGLLNTTELQVLEEWCAELGAEQNIDVVLLVIPNLMGKSAQSFADDFYDNNRYGPDGVLLLLDIGSRQWHISTSGAVTDALSDRDLADIEERVIPYFSENRFYDGFCRFLDILPDHLTNSDGSGSFSLPVSLLAGAAIAAVALLVMRGTMNTKRPQRSAVSYEVEGTYQLRQHQDLFLYSTITKREKPKNNGSSTHRSSSGRSHGGRGGSF